MEKQKIQMTEEQARKFYQSLSDFITVTQDGFIGFLKQLGYIRKSELQTLVEEAEEMYSVHVEYKGKLSGDEKNNIIDKLYRTIQALKKVYPEFKERSEK